MAESGPWLGRALLALAVVVAGAVWWFVPRAVIGGGEIGLVYRRGIFRRELQSGRYFVLPGRVVRLVCVIPQTLEVRPDAILTDDQIAVRITAVITFQVAARDARAAVERDVLTPIGRVCHVAEYVLREMAERRTLAELFEDRTELDAEFAAGLVEGENPIPGRIAIRSVSVRVDGAAGA